jgi:two-component system chemotaxis response regulator CheB
LSDALKSDPEIDVVGTASDGKIALAKISQVNPDLITLDVEMPGWSGLETLVEIRKLYAKLPIIMFSTLTDHGAAATLEALARGASDYATKPSNTGSLKATTQRIHEELIPKIKALCPQKSPAVRNVAKPSLAPKPAAKSAISRFDVVAIGVSTGGPNALAELLPGFKADFPVPIVIVQHMPAIFTRLLAERLNKGASLKVQEGQAGAALSPGCIWIAPGDFHMVAKRAGTEVQLGMNQDPPENSCRPSVDVLFRSVAKAYGSHALAVVLTGMGSDGVAGARHIREAGGQVLVQDEATSVVWGMPGQVAAAGQADGIYPLHALPQTITRQVESSRSGETYRNPGTQTRPATASQPSRSYLADKPGES